MLPSRSSPLSANGTLSRFSPVVSVALFVLCLSSLIASHNKTSSHGTATPQILCPSATLTAFFAVHSNILGCSRCRSISMSRPAGRSILGSCSTGWSEQCNARSGRRSYEQQRQAQIYRGKMTVSSGPHLCLPELQYRTKEKHFDDHNALYESSTHN